MKLNVREVSRLREVAGGRCVSLSLMPKTTEQLMTYGLIELDRERPRPAFSAPSCVRITPAGRAALEALS